MTEALKAFINFLQSDITLDENLVLNKNDKYFLVNEDLKKIVSADFYYAGVYLGKTENNQFYPSFILLQMIAKTNANKVAIDKKTEWLFICGRDIFKQGITQALGSKKKGDYVLVMNQHNECLGFGKILQDLNEKAEGAVIENLLDIGDFLRREKRKKQLP